MRAGVLEPTHQSHLELKDGDLIPYGPKAPKEIAEFITARMNQHIIDKRTPAHWKHFHCVPVKTN